MVKHNHEYQISKIIEEQLELNFVLKNLLIILQAGSHYNYHVFILIVVAWIQTHWIINFLNAKGKQKAIWNPFQTVIYFRNAPLRRISVFYFCLPVFQFGLFQKIIKKFEDVFLFWVAMDIQKNCLQLQKSQKS